MKIKQIGRIVGAFNAGTFGFAEYLCYSVLSNTHYNFFVEDRPFEQKIIAGAYLGAVATLVPIAALGITDGLVDVIKGTHHYFGCKVWQKLTRNEKKRVEIESELVKQLKRIEEPIGS